MATRRRDDTGRRLYASERTAFAAQQRAVKYHGIWSGVIKVGNYWCLLFDPEAE